MVTAEKNDIRQTIGKAAEKVGVSPSTLRLLEAQAQVLPYRTDSNLRLYDEEMIIALCNFREEQKNRKSTEKTTRA